MIRTTLYRANTGFLLRHPWQLAMAVLGIAIGVAVIVAVDLANASARKAFLLSMDAVTGKATHQVVGGPVGLDEQVYVDLRARHGFRSIAPVVEGNVFVDGRSLQVLGIDLFAEQELRSFTGDAEAAEDDDSSVRVFFQDMLTVDGAVVMAAATAEQLEMSPGDSFEVSTGGRKHVAQLIGTYAADVATGVDAVLTADIATAQVWFGMEGRLSRIDARLPDGDAAAVADLEARLPPEAHVLAAAGRTRSTADMSQGFMTNLTAMSLLALLVGLFLIYNSVSFSVLQRRQLIGTLRALGITRREAFGLVLGEAAVVGSLAALTGLALGIWLGDQLLALVAQSINDFYFRVTVTDVSLDALSLAKGIVAGIGAALVAAAIPALEAASYQPRLSLARSVLERRAGRLLPWVTASGVVIMLAALAVLALSGRSLVAGLVAVFMLILGFALCVPQVVRLLTRWLTPVAGRAAGVWGRLAVAGISASLSRTGVAIVALAVAVSATIGVSVMVDSFRGSVSHWLEQSLQADIYAGLPSGGMDPALIREFGEVEGVIAVSTNRRVRFEDDAGRMQLRALGMVPQSLAGVEILDADAASVWPAFERDDVVLVSEPYAYRNQVGRGDILELRTATGLRPFEIVATYQSYDVNGSAVLMSRTVYDRYYDDPTVDSIGLYLADGIVPDAVIAELEAIRADGQQLLIDSNVKIRDLSLEIFDRTFVITDVLYWLALGVAMIGILGAMLALQLERARDFAILRAVGMTPGQLGAMIVLQTAVIGLLAGIAAMPLGVVMAYVLIEVINRRAFGWQIDMAVAPDILISAVVFAVMAAVIAGLYPALRAARSVPALAMREE